MSKPYIFLFIGLIVCAIRFFYISSENEYFNLVGQKFLSYGLVAEEPSFSSSGNQIVVIRPEGFFQKIRASLYNSSSVSKGDYVKFAGVVKLPENFDGFNYVKYLQKDNIYAEVSKAQIIPIHKAKSNWQLMLIKLRIAIGQKINFELPKDQAGLILGMLIGDDSKLSKLTKDAFQKTGLTHVLVVSGFNLTILAASTSVIAWLVGRKIGDLLSLATVWVFVFLVGVQASIIRAAIMISLLLIARMFGRLSYSYITLLWTIVVMAIINPLQVFYDIGFQLSVAATFGVLEAHKLKSFLGKEGFLSEILWPSLGAIIFTAPIVAYYFHVFSTVALISNLLIVPTIPLVMLLGALLLIPGITQLARPIISLILSIDMKIVNWLAGWQFSTINFQPHLVTIFSYYIIVLIVEYFIFSPARLDLKKTAIRGRITKIKL